MKILFIIVTIFLNFGVAHITDAAPTCDSVGGVPVFEGDPACYDVAQDCKWVKIQNMCRMSMSDVCPGYKDYFMAVDFGVSCGSVSSRRSCKMPDGTKKYKWSPWVNYPYYVYENSCDTTQIWCNNAPPPPLNKPEVCYYWKASAYSDCDSATGLQYPIDFELLSKEGTDCENESALTPKECGTCGIKNGQPSQDAPTNPGLCTMGDPLSGPTLNPAGDEWEWVCEGGDVTTSDDDAFCNAPREAPGACNDALNGKILDSTPAENTLCQTGVYRSNSLTGGSNGPWTWICDPIGTSAVTDVCSAECFDYEVNIQPRSFYWSENNADVEVVVNISKTGLCASEYSCTITIDGTSSGTGVESFTHEISPGKNGYEVLTVCEYNGDSKERTAIISGNCVQRSCNAQGQCQPSPQSAASSDACQSTCSSNADCTRGRMIETRP